jgi:pyruvate kinase
MAAVEGEAISVLEELRALRADVRERAEATLARWRPRLERPAFVASAANLAQYLALRRHDLRSLQNRLMPLGLSSLGRCEARVMANLDAVIASLERICDLPPETDYPAAAAFFRGNEQLAAETGAVFGPEPEGRQVRIMVTLPGESAGDPDFIRRLVERGMDVARINCAHDGPDTWARMVDHVRRASSLVGRSCKVSMDLCGPRARTEAIYLAGGDGKLRRGDRFVLTRGEPGAGREVPMKVECALAEAVDQIEVGQRVAIDEGKTVGRVVERVPGGLLIEVTHAPENGARIRPNKGLNFPDTALELAPLTESDLRVLDTVAELADVIGYSFVQRPADLAWLHDELEKRTPRAGAIAIQAKIETALAVKNLPELIVEGAGRRPFAVMIARGDLAVEIGYQRLAEIQEELLWLCEAAHVPVVWATQVMDAFVRTGTPARGELTDAAMAERAECVMLNKGPHILEGVTIMAEVMQRMEGHQSKKTSRLRALKSW